MLAVCEQGGLHLFDWQSDVDGVWVSRGHDGRWACPTCGISLARQNGKTMGTVVARSDYGLSILGEQIIYTAHLQKTSTEAFEAMAAFFDSQKMRKHVKSIRSAVGREQITMRNGARVKFLARTRNGGRGQHCDLLIFDEAQELTDEQQSSFLPCISASDNPQTIYSGTPPDPGNDGGVMRRIRGNAIDGADGIAWHEWSVDEIGDVRDRSRWYATNPSLGITILESTISTECEQMSDDTFARERLGWWSDMSSAAVEHIISAASWDRCEVAAKDAPSDGVRVFAVKFSPDGTVGTVSACVRPPDGTPYVEVVENRDMAQGMDWFTGFCADVASTASQIIIDGGGNAQTLCDTLDGKVPRGVVIRPTSQQMAGADAMMLNAVVDGNVTHMGQPALDASATLTTRRSIGRGWGFESTDAADSTLIESCALALWGANTTRRNPARRMRVL